MHCSMMELFCVMCRKNSASKFHKKLRGLCGVQDFHSNEGIQERDVPIESRLDPRAKNRTGGQRMGRYKLCKEWKFVETVEATCPYCSKIVSERTRKFPKGVQGYGTICCSKCSKDFRLDSYDGVPT